MPTREEQIAARRVARLHDLINAHGVDHPAVSEMVSQHPELGDVLRARRERSERGEE
jgi:hypothetical protein